MSELFRRDWRVLVGIETGKFLDVSAVDLEFSVMKSIKPEPNKVQLILYNMNETHRTQLLKRNRPAEDKGIPLVIEAGHKGGMFTVFTGDLEESSSQKESNIWRTEIHGTDFGRQWREARISQQFTAGTSIGTIIKRCADEMNVGLGNLNNFLAETTIEGIGKTIPRNWSCDGSVVAEMDRLMKSCKLVWSIQNGALQIQKKGVPIQGSKPVISSNTGLIGSPESTIDATVSLGNAQTLVANLTKKTPVPPKAKDPGIIKWRCLLNPEVAPGRLIEMRSNQYDGDYMVTHVNYNAKTWAKEWYCDCVGRIYKE